MGLNDDINEEFLYDMVRQEKYVYWDFTIELPGVGGVGGVLLAA